MDDDDARANQHEPLVAPPTDRTSLDPRGRILGATKELLAEIGWSRTTTRKVADRAGVNNALVHYYFGTKRALLLQAATDALMTEFSGAIEAFERHDDLGRGLQDALVWLENAARANAATRIFAELMLQAMHDPALQTTMRVMLREFRELVAARAMAQGLPPPRATGLAAVVAAVLDGLYLHALLDAELDVPAAAHVLEPLLSKEAP
jgi:AcrR family transcriptional regulator